MTNSIIYYKKATVKYTTSEKGSRGRFTYTNHEYKDCLIKVIGSTVNIVYYNKIQNVVIHFTKMSYGKYFSFSGTECSKISFNRIANNWKNKVIHTKTLRDFQYQCEKILKIKQYNQNLNIVSNVIKQKEEKLNQIILEEQKKCNMDNLTQEQKRLKYQAVWNRLISIVGFEYVKVVKWGDIQELIKKHFDIGNFFYISTQ